MIPIWSWLSLGLGIPMNTGKSPPSCDKLTIIELNRPMYFTGQTEYLKGYICQYGKFIIRHSAGNALKLHFTASPKPKGQADLVEALPGRTPESTYVRDGARVQRSSESADRCQQGVGKMGCITRSLTGEEVKNGPGASQTSKTGMLLFRTLL